MTDSSRWVPLAAVARPHGVRGELRLRVFNQDSDLLLDVERVRIREETYVVDSARRANEAILMKLEGLDDRDEVEDLRGADVCVRRDEFPPLDDGEFYACDVEGARALLGDEEIGVVKEMRTYPSVDVFLVEGAKRWEIPITDTYIERVDVDRKEVRVKTLDDLEPA